MDIGLNWPKRCSLGAVALAHSKWRAWFCLAVSAFCLFPLPTSLAALATRDAPIRIVVGSRAEPLERYAAQELQRYLYALAGEHVHMCSNEVEIFGPTFVVGQRQTNPLLKRLAAEQKLSVAPNNPGPQGYVLKNLRVGGFPVIAAAGSDATGCLYAVYGLLQDHYDVGFSLTGDVLPERADKLRWVEVDERKCPLLKSRGVLPWTNFPQSPSSYSWEDWRFILDQMAKMRFNLLFIHNYGGEQGHNEMFANFTLNGATPRSAMPTARTGHGWHGPGWDVTQYRFGAADLFDDYDFGADCALHNESLNNLEAFRKGVALFQRVIDHAHARGIKVALGLDIDMVPGDSPAAADDPALIRARVDQLAGDYPALDYLVCFQSENVAKTRDFHSQWQKIFLAFYEQMKQRIPHCQLAVSGWGLEGGVIRALPPDVICAPIAAYSDEFENGAAYSRREFWGVPWLERDQTSSQYYYPYNMHLWKTMAAVQHRSTNMSGLVALTWRLGDAIDPKLCYISRAAWDPAITRSRDVYRQYAALNYGRDAADTVALLLDGNEPFASEFGECQGTPFFLPSSPAAFRRSCLGHGDSSRELKKCAFQIGILDGLIASPQRPPNQRARLQTLRCRFAAGQDHLLLNENADSYTWSNLPGVFESWVHNFTHRVTDISSLGNVVSTQNRFIQLRYAQIENKLRQAQAINPPSRVEARGTPAGAEITWENEEPPVAGFWVTFNGKRIHDQMLPASERRFAHSNNSRGLYSVIAVNHQGAESLPSVPSYCEAGRGDLSPPDIVAISPPGTALAGQRAPIKARLLDGRAYSELSCHVVWRHFGAHQWTRLPMARRVKSTFTADLSSEDGQPIEYFIEASDGDNGSRFPPSSALTLVWEGLAPAQAPLPPDDFAAKGGILTWSASSSDSHCYVIYRSRNPTFQPDSASSLTCVAGSTLSFRDQAPDFAGLPLRGAWFYRVTAKDRHGYESTPTEAAGISK